jgi:hypothetical protein
MRCPLIRTMQTHLLGSRGLSHLGQSPAGLLQIGRWGMGARLFPVQRCLGEIFGTSLYEGGQQASWTMPEGLLPSFLVSQS